MTPEAQARSRIDARLEQTGWVIQDMKQLDLGAGPGVAVRDYFDAFLIGLTATPNKRSYGFFKQNVLAEYIYEQSVTDGVNVDYDVYPRRHSTVS